MTTIWKARIPPIVGWPLKVPKGTEFISAREQGDDICVWYKCDPDAPLESRFVKAFPTGGEAPPLGNEWKFLGTASLDGGALIYHVFEHIHH